MLRGSDVLHISWTHCAGLGLSILRDGEPAAGAVTHVPLGPTVSVRHPPGTDRGSRGDLPSPRSQIRHAELSGGPQGR